MNIFSLISVVDQFLPFLVPSNPLSLIGEVNLGFNFNDGLNETVTQGFQTINQNITQGFGTTHQMINSLQNTVGVLQTTTAFIGVTSVIGVGLSTVNLHQTIKLRNDVKQLKYQIEDGFIKVLEQTKNIPDEVEFRHHRTILMMAYSKFLQATKLMKSALSIDDIHTRKNTLSNAQLLLSNALSAYNQPDLLQNINAAAFLRRLECAWMIEQTQAVNFQLLNELKASRHCLSHLQERIKTDSLNIINRCSSQEELDFIYPEITRITRQDVPILDQWKTQINLIEQLNSSEKQELIALIKSNPEQFYHNINEGNITDEEPMEITEYSQLSLQDQLRYIINPNLRQEHKKYLLNSSFSDVISVNFDQVSDTTIANLYHYTKG
jgi:hypothetical protein